MCASKINQTVFRVLLWFLGVVLLFMAIQEYMHAYDTMAIVFLIEGVLFLTWSRLFRINKKSGG